MKLWLTKFRISAAQDSGKPLPASLREKIAANPELEHFTRQTEALEEALRNPPRSDPSLHDDIMQTLRASRRRERPQRAPSSSWLAPSAAMLAVAAFGFWMTQPRPVPRTSQPLDGPAMVLDMSETVPAAMPDVVMAPLSNEWARVNHDVQGTTQILLACFP